MCSRTWRFALKTYSAVVVGLPDCGEAVFWGVAVVFAENGLQSFGLCGTACDQSRCLANCNNDQTTHSFSSVIVRDGRGQVVGDMSAGNVMSLETGPKRTVQQKQKKGQGEREKKRTDEEVKDVTIHGAKGATLEVPLAGSVVREGLVGVLKEGDEHKPVVAEHVGDAVVADDVPERGGTGPHGEGGKGDGDAEVRLDDLPELSLFEHDRVGGEVCRMVVSSSSTGACEGGTRRTVGESGVRALATGIANEVHPPAD